MRQYTCTALLNAAVCCTALLDAAVCCTTLLDAAVCLHRVAGCGSMLYRVVGCGSMPHLSRYHTLHVAVRGLRIWPPNAAKCCKNASKFFPDVYSVRLIYKLITAYMTWLILYPITPLVLTL